MLGIKYIINSDEYNNALYNNIYKNEDYFIYENPYALSIAFAVSSQLESVNFSYYSTPFELLNEAITAMLGENDTVMLFKPIQNVNVTTVNATRSFATHDYIKYVPADSSEKSSIKYSFTSPTTDEIFFFYPSEYPRKVSLQLNNRDWGTFFDNETDRIVSLGSYDIDQNVTLSVSLERDDLYLLYDSSYFWYMDSEVFKDVFTKLNENKFEIDEYSSTYLKGKIKVDKNNDLLFTSIPYDEGWHIICDGEELSPIKTCDSLIAAQINEGEHTLELVYSPKCFKQGLIVSITGAVVFVLIIFLDIFIKAKRKKRKQKIKQVLDDFYNNFNLPDTEKNTEEPKNTDDTAKNE